MLKKIVIHIDKRFTNDTWRLIFKLYDYCHRGGSTFSALDFDTLEKSSLSIRYNNDVRLIDAIAIYGNGLDYCILNDELSNCTEFFISVVCVKEDASLDNPDYLPLISWLTDGHSVYDKNDFSFGVDISSLKKEDKSRYIYTIGQRFSIIDSLPTPRASKRCIYYIENYNEGKITKNFPYSLSHNAPSSSKSLSLPIDEDSLVAYFSPQWEMIENVGQKKLLDSIGEINIHVNGTISLLEEWLVKAYLDCVVLNNESVQHRYELIKDNLHEYCNSVYELVQNIIFHTEEKTGTLSMRFYKKKDLRYEFRQKIPFYDDYSEDDRFLMFDLYDNGTVGIVNTFYNENHNNGTMEVVDTNNYPLALNHFFNPKEILPDENINLTLRYVAHLGIKTFVSSVVNNGGYFYVETNKEKYTKESLEISNEEIVCSNEKYGSVGTRYHVVLPIKKRLSPISAPIRVVDKEWPIGDNHLTDIDVATYNSILYDAKVIKVTSDKKNNIDKKDNQKKLVREYGEQIIRRIVNTTASNICIDTSQLGDFSPNFLFKLIAYTRLNIPYQHQPNALVFYNIYDNTLNRIEEIACSMTESFSKKKQEVWSEKYTVVLLSKKMQILILCGNTKDRFCYINHELRKFYSNALKNIPLEYYPLSAEERKDLIKHILHYEVVSAFASHIESEVLVNPIEDTNTTDTGCVVKIPARLGDKIYIDEFYQADHIFLNGFYTTKFAICIARNIIDRLKELSGEKNVVILGYNQYSKLLIDCISKILTDYSKRSPQANCNIEQLVIGYEEKEKDKKVEETEKNGKKYRHYDRESNELQFDIVSTPLKPIFHKKNCNAEGPQKVIKNNNNILVTVVPIATTLTTFDKLISCYKKWCPSFQIDNEYNHCTILIRDKDKDDKRESANDLTILENEWGWKDLNESNRTITVGERVINYLCLKKTKWHRLIDENTFPSDDFSKEKFIVRTHNSSLNVSNLLRYPEMSIPPDKSNNNQLTDYFKFTGSRLVDMKNYIHFGHLIKDEKHYRYYFDVPGYIEESERVLQSLQPNLEQRRKDWPALYKWVRGYLVTNVNSVEDPNEVGGRLREKEAYINVIVTSEPDKNPRLTAFINKHLFGDNAYVIFLDIHDRDFKYKHSIIRQLETFGQQYHNINSRNWAQLNMENTKSKYVEEWHIDNKLINYYFVDRALLTGNAYFTAKRQMAEIHNDSKFQFTGIITIINRLSQYKYKEISEDLIIKDGIYSFNHIFIPPCKLENTDCYLCSLKDSYDNLKENSVITDCRNIIESNKAKYNPRKIENNNAYDAVDRERAFLRMQWQNRIFYEITDANLSNSQEKIEEKSLRINGILNALFDESGQTVDDRISFLKAISSLPLSEYARIRQYAFAQMLVQLKQVLNKDRPKLGDLIMLKVLLKQLAILGSNALVRKGVIVGSWNLYKKVKEQMQDEIEDVRSNIRSIKKQQKLQFNDALSVFEKRASDIADYVSGKDNKKVVFEYIVGDTPKGFVINEKECKLYEFPKQLLFYIKLAIHNDPSKSLWLGELLRTGEEMDIDKYNSVFHVSETRMYNSLFKDSPIGTDNVILPYLFYENTTIIRKTLDNFEKEKIYFNKEKKELKTILYDDNRKIQQIREIVWNRRNELISELTKRVCDNYYYNWFRKFYRQDKNDGFIRQDISVDGIRLIEKHTFVLYARLLLRRLFNGAHETFEENAEHLLEVFANIIDAQAAYVSIRPDWNNQITHTLSLYYSTPDYYIDKEAIRYNKSFYSIMLLNNCDKVNQGRPFVMRKKIDKYGECFNGKFNRAAFLSLNFPLGKDNGVVEENTVGMVTFLFGGSGQDKVDENQFIKEKQELGRLLLLLKPEIDKYVKHVAEEKLFEEWSVKEHMTKINLSTNHQLHLGYWDFDNIPAKYYKKMPNCMIMFSDLTIRHLYALLLERRRIDIEADIISIGDVFNSKFLSLLDVLGKSKGMKINYIHPSDINLYDIKLRGVVTVYRSFIIQLILNAWEHAHSKLFNITFHDSYLSFGNEVKKTPEKISELETAFNEKYNEIKMEEFINSPSRSRTYGFTLIALHYYCKSSNNNKPSMGYVKVNGKAMFNVKLYYYEKNTSN